MGARVQGEKDRCIFNTGKASVFRCWMARWSHFGSFHVEIPRKTPGIFKIILAERYYTRGRMYQVCKNVQFQKAEP